MGAYLNSTKPSILYKSESAKPYFVDKTMLLQELAPLIEQGNNFICITRPRRFGKTIMANMMGAFFGKTKDTSSLFNKLNIAGTESYTMHLNHHNVIYISFNELPKNCNTYNQYINRIQKRLTDDLIRSYPELMIDKEDAVWDILDYICESGYDARFIFVLDEWDFIFHKDFVTDKDKKSYISFLSCLLKDKPYVSLAYMTGILPIAKYSSGSELNIFLEYTMTSEERFSGYFGFTETEVNCLYTRYKTSNENQKVTREGLRIWYDGYHTFLGERVYNPCSVVASLTNNNLGNYWTSSGPYDEIFYYIEKNAADVRDDIALMVSGESVPSKIQEYAATSMSLQTKDEIYSAMVVYGFLSYDNGKVSIPNKELMNKFSDMLRKEPSLGYVNRLAKESGKEDRICC